MAGEDRFKNSNFTEVFGELKSRHFPQRGCFENFAVPAVLLFLLFFGVATYLGSEDKLTIPFCIVIPFLLFCGMIWHLFKTRRDELQIYENGFTYKSRKQIQTCLWSEIKFCHRRDLSDRDIVDLKDDEFPLDSVEKKNGEMIAFESDISGTHEILKRFEKKE